MDTKAKRTTRLVKPKTIPTASLVSTIPVNPNPVQPPAAPTSLPDPTPTEPPKNTEADNTGTQKLRTQTNKLIGINISAARVRRHLDKLNLNSTIDASIKVYKVQINKHDTAKTLLETGKITVSVEKEVDGKLQWVDETRDITQDEKTQAEKVVAEITPDIADMKAKVNALSRERVRFSNEAPLVLAIICDEIVQQLVSHTMDRALEAKKKIIQISHLHEPGVEKLSLYPLVKSLPTFASTAEKLAKAAQDEKETTVMNDILAQAEKDFKKKYNIHVPKKKKDVLLEQLNAVVAAVVEPAEACVDEDEDENSPDSKISFKFYVSQVCKDVIKKNDKYKVVRVSTDIRGYLSDIIIEFIQRISPLVLLTALSMKNKTINDVAILRTIESLLIDGHKSLETVSLKGEKVPDPTIYKAELLKRDEERKAGNKGYKIDIEKIPTVNGYAATHVVLYPTSGYDQLAQKATQKLTLYKELPQKDKVTLTEAQ